MTLLSAAVTLTLVLYAVAIALALVRLFRGPRAQDRVIALDVAATVAMLLMLALAIRYDSTMYFEAALLKLKESALTEPQVRAIREENARRLLPSKP